MSIYLPRGCRNRLDVDSGCKNSLQRVSFHTTPLEWDIGPAPESDDEAGIKRLEEIYRDTAMQVRDLMEALRGEGAP